MKRPIRCILLVLVSLPLTGCGTDGSPRMPGAPSVEWSPNGRQLATDWGGQIRLVDVTGAHQQILSTPAGIAAGPRFSPDGRMLAFCILAPTSDPALAVDLWICHLSTRRIVRIGRVASTPASPALAAPANQRASLEYLRSQREMADILRTSVEFLGPISWRSDSRAVAYITHDGRTDPGRATDPMRFYASKIAVADLERDTRTEFGRTGLPNLRPVFEPQGQRLLFNSGWMWLATDKALKSDFEVRLWAGDGRDTRLVLRDSAVSVTTSLNPLAWRADGQDLVLLRSVEAPVWQCRLTEVGLDGALGRQLGTFAHFLRSLDSPLQAIAYEDPVKRELLYGRYPFANFKTLRPALPNYPSTTAVVSPDLRSTAEAIQYKALSECDIRIYDVRGGDWRSFRLRTDAPSIPLKTEDASWLQRQLRTEARRAWFASPAGGLSFLALGLGLAALAVLLGMLARVLAHRLARR